MRFLFISYSSSSSFHVKKSYFTSIDPHHDMSGGGCQVRVEQRQQNPYVKFHYKYWLIHRNPFHHQTFQVPKMEAFSPWYKLYGYGLCKGKTHPQNSFISGSGFLHFRYIPETFGDIMACANPIYIWVVFHPLYKTTNQGFESLLMWWLSWQPIWNKRISRKKKGVTKAVNHLKGPFP